MRHLASRAFGHPAIAAMLTLGLIVGGWGAARAGGPVYTFVVALGSNCIGGGGPNGAAFSIQLKDRDGTSVQTKHGSTAAGGSWSLCLKRAVNSGDRLTVNDGEHHRTFTVPGLTVSVNRATDVVAGRAPAGVTVRITGTHRTTLIGGVPFPEVATTASANRQYSADLTGAVDLSGGDSYLVRYFTSSGDTIYRLGYVPYFVATLGESSITANVNRGQLVSFTSRDSSGAVKGSARDIADITTGEIDTQLADRFGGAIWTRAGDRIRASFSADAQIKVPPMALTANASSDVASGRCAASVGFEVYAYHTTGGFAFASQFGTTKADGKFSVDMSKGASATYDLKSGDFIAAVCRLGAGDRIDIQRHVP